MEKRTTGARGSSVATQIGTIGSKVCPRSFRSIVCPQRTNYGSSHKKIKGFEGKGDRWGLNPQPLEPQSRALPIELRSPRF